MLVTDLAHGWIPPGLNLPADVRLLEGMDEEWRTFSLENGLRFEAELHADLKAIGGSPKFMTVHGEEESCLQLAQELHTELGTEAIAPRVGEVHDV